MSESSDLLKGLCPDSDKDLGAEIALSGIRCETCSRTIHVDRRGMVRGHYRNSFHYLDTKGFSKELEFTGLESGRIDPRLFGFRISDPGADRVTACMRFSLSELKRLHEFVGSVISLVELEYANNPVFEAQLGRADDHMKSPHGPIVY